MTDAAETVTSLSLATHKWGPRRLANGQTRFQLWAPVETSVKLRLSGRDVEMERASGWYHVDVNVPYGETYAFLLSNGRVVGDPASRQQAADVDGASVLIDPGRYLWENPGWRAHPWKEAVIYEIHIGAFTAEGTFRAAIERLPYLAELGITAVEVMPLAHFPGRRGWGYDGVLQFAPHNAFGTPDDLKAFIDAAHGFGLMVFLDVVYNHFGPEGNYLGQYAPGFFRKGVDTPWGTAIAYEQKPVRDYFIENVLYWLSEFRLDGLRFDAIDQIEDKSRTHILEEFARTVREEIRDREVHLITENPANGTDLMAERAGGRFYKADWNDDFHHALHVAVTGEGKGYYAPFADGTWDKLRHTLAKGYLSPGKPIIGDEAPPGEALPPTAFVHFLQNHDQVGNRALGDRLYAAVDIDLYRALTEMLLSPQIPLLFMGDDHLSQRAFHFFADYSGDIGRAVRENRPKEAANFGGLPEGIAPADFADPNSEATFLSSKLDWREADTDRGRGWTERLRMLITLRREDVPLLDRAAGHSGCVIDAPDRCLFIDWSLGDTVLQMRANLSEGDIDLDGGLGDRIHPAETGSTLAAKSVQVFLL